jgi:hypothetical protein
VRTENIRRHNEVTTERRRDGCDAFPPGFRNIKRGDGSMKVSKVLKVLRILSGILAAGWALLFVLYCVSIYEPTAILIGGAMIISAIAAVRDAVG